MMNKNNSAMTNQLISIMIDLLKAMDIQFDQFSVAHFISKVELFTGWKVQLIFSPIHAQLNSQIDGFWVRNPKRKIHYIFVDSTISLLRQHNTIFHESGHILQKHPTLAIPNLSHLDFDQVLMRKRDDINKQYEFEAELFSYVLQSLVSRSKPNLEKNIYYLVN